MISCIYDPTIWLYISQLQSYVLCFWLYISQYAFILHNYKVLSDNFGFISYNMTLCLTIAKLFVIFVA